jgi:hypothetical protein
LVYKGGKKYKWGKEHPDSGAAPNIVLSEQNDKHWIPHDIPEEPVHHGDKKEKVIERASQGIRIVGNSGFV